MSIYRGVDGTNKKIKTQYRGITGVNRIIKEQYRGVGGANRKIFQLEQVDWIADNSKNGTLGSLELNNPSSDSKPTILEVNGLQAVTSNPAEVSIVCNQLFLTTLDTIEIDWEYERDTQYHAWIEFHLGKYAILPYDAFSNYSFARRIDSFSGNAVGVFSVKIVKRTTLDRTIRGKLKIYNIWINGTKVL